LLDAPAEADELQRLLEDLDAAMLPPARMTIRSTTSSGFLVENAQGVGGDSEEPFRERLRSFPNLVLGLSAIASEPLVE